MVQHICDVVAEYEKKLVGDAVNPRVIIWMYDAAGR